MSLARTRRAHKTEKTRELILAAARDLFTTKGYEDITVRDLAARAGVAPGTIYLHFRDKEDLLYQVSEEHFRLLLDRLRRLPRSRDIRQRLHDALLEVIRFGINDPNDYQLMMGFRAALGGEKSSDQWGPKAEQVGSFFVDLMQEAYKRGIFSPASERLDELMLMALLDGVVLTIVINDIEQESAEALAEHMVARMLTGMSELSKPESGSE